MYKQEWRTREEHHTDIHSTTERFLLLVRMVRRAVGKRRVRWTMIWSSLEQHGTTRESIDEDDRLLACSSGSERDLLMNWGECFQSVMRECERYEVTSTWDFPRRSLRSQDDSSRSKSTLVDVKFVINEDSSPKKIQWWAEQTSHSAVTRRTSSCSSTNLSWRSFSSEIWPRVINSWF